MVRKYLFFLFFLTISAQERQFIFTHVNNNFFSATEKVTCYYNNQEIGSLYYDQLPGSFFVIHTFFIDPEYRNKGHGLALLGAVCAALKKRGARKIIIQPGPFENTGNITEPAERAQRIESLVRMYTKIGFGFANCFVAQSARLVYVCMGIDEDPCFLMTM